MKKNRYLDISLVDEFIKWFVSDAQILPHNYFNRDLRRHCGFESLSDSLEKYYWPFNSFYDCKGSRHISISGHLKESAHTLNCLQLHLRSSVYTDFVEYKESAKALMAWGGTTNRNNDWFDDNNNLKVVHQTIAVLKEQDDDLLLLQSIKNLRFNAGLTKLYALILDDFIIYDSRVAAALSWYVLKFTETKKLAVIPPELKFACMPARGKQVRNPHANKLGFPGMYNNSAKHLHWNIRANWILSKSTQLMKESLSLRDSSFFKQSDINPIRAIEAALFMWGYDLHDPLQKE